MQLLLSDLSPELPGLSSVLRCLPKPITIAPMVLLYQSVEIPVTLNAGKNTLLWSDTLLKLTHLVLATDSGNWPVVWVWTGKIVHFGSRPIWKPDPLLHGGPNPYPYLLTLGFCWVWQDPSVSISSSHSRDSLFMVAFGYPTVMCKILTLVHHCLCLLYWLPS